ncbi:major facilitator superfamily domain-containing protein [Rhodotorula diobovata]|uniref:Major facilitator superfamily domain-containing protein n=1 Tax=Rhodotorula diobovata TaxID=5288 RepID=A0A5C5G6Q5_9BASI|nr:major facilitator superfamily domain-containing protein [Rhodotorula diobovata]
MADLAAAAALPPVPHRTRLGAFYASPVVQVVLISLICFCTPGMFNALSGVGGGGQLDPSAANKANVALYACFAVVGFFSGSVINRIGARLAFSIGAAGYALYMGSLLNYNIRATNGFVVAAGALLGVSAGLLWTAQGSLVLSYATEAQKGRLFGLFWFIFHMGATLGSAIEVGLTWQSTDNTVGNAVYAAFLAIAAVGALIPFLLVDPATMVRSDGTRVIPPIHPTWKNEFQGMWQLVRKETVVLLLFPLFFSSNFMYTWEQNSYNGALGTLRARSLNSLLFWLAQMFGAGIFGVLIDLEQFRRKNRAWVGLGFLLAFHMAIWGASFHKQRAYYRTPEGASIPRIDVDDSTYGGFAALYFFQGALDAITQNYIYWLMGAISNSPAQLARLVGLYKGIQSAGAAGAFAMDSAMTPYMNELAATWAVCVAGLLFAAPVVHWRITDHTEDEPVIVVDQPVLAAADAVSVSSGAEKKGDETV